MIQIRHNVFETNSSSTHSICIPKKTDIKRDSIYFGIGEYGWENDEVDAPSYLYTAILCTYGYNNAVAKIEELKSILDSHSIKYFFEEPVWYEWDSGYKSLDNGYIDHAYETSGFVNAVLNNEDMLLRYLFNGTVYTGNDNDDCHPSGCNIADEYMWGYDENDEWVEEPNPYHDPENFDYFYKGN